MDRVEVVRECFEAYATGERGRVERHLAADLAFFSPADPGIGLDAYWERCWPNAAALDGFELVRVIEAGDEVVVTYEARRTDGTRFRNTEVLTFAGEKVARVEVYFGWNLGQSS